MVVSFPQHFRRSFPHLIGGRVLVALSGGCDSVALLHLLALAELSLSLEAIHVHHGARGSEADEDQEFCRDLCGRLGVPFHLHRLTPEAAPPEGREAGWRRLRYSALLAAASRLEASAVATGHHRDDVAEGVLVQLLRGAGPRALAGIAQQTPEGVIRPLLPWGRSELVAWLERAGHDWREDSSNASSAHLRNVVRHDVLPALERVSPSIRGHLVSLATALAEDEAYFARELSDRSLWIDPWEPEGGVPLAEIDALPPPLRTRWLHALTRRCGIGRATRRQAELLHRMVATGEPRAVALAGRWRLRRARSRLWLEPPRPPEPYGIELVPGELAALPLQTWFIRLLRPWEKGDPGARWRRSLGRGTTFSVRAARPDDLVEHGGRPQRLAPLLAGALPLHLRAAWPVVCVDDTITWVPGVWKTETGGGSDRQVVEVLRR